MISVPAIAIFIVVGVGEIVRLRYWIAGSILFFFLFFLFLLYRRRKAYKKTLEKDKEELLKILEQAINKGHEVNISFLGGILKISYKPKQLPAKKEILLPESSDS